MKQTLCLSRGFQGGSSSPSTPPPPPRELSLLSTIAGYNERAEETKCGDSYTKLLVVGEGGSRRVHNDMPPSEWAEGGHFS